MKKGIALIFAREAGCALLVVERPRRETGLTLEEIQKKLMEEENA